MVPKKGAQRRTRLYRRGGSNAVAAALAIGWKLTAGHLSPVVEQKGNGGWSLVAAVCRPRASRDCLAMLRLGVRSSFSRSLAGVASDEIMKIGDWKMEQMARCCSRTITTRAPAVASSKLKRNRDSKRERTSDYGINLDLPLPGFTARLRACTPPYAPGGNCTAHKMLKNHKRVAR